jgi:hypothetical protein
MLETPALPAVLELKPPPAPATSRRESEAGFPENVALARGATEMAEEPPPPVPAAPQSDNPTAR